MNTLYEYTDKLNAPFECFICDSSNCAIPVTPHWHYFVEILFMLKGSILVNSGEQSYVLCENDMILFLPQSIHSIYSTSNFPFRYYVLKFDAGQLMSSSNSLGSGIPFRSLFSIAKASINKENHSADIFFPDGTFFHSDMHRLFEECTRELQQQNYGYRTLIQSNISILFTHILRHWRSRGFDTDQVYTLTNTETSIHSITEYIDSHASEPLKVSSLAALCNMSYSYFAKNFQELYGQSCKKYIEFVRLCKAEDLLLSSNLDLNYICQETGFSDCSYFIKIFRTRYHMTPTQFRNAHLYGLQ